MTAIELKNYIYTEHKIEYILEQIGCHSIVYHPDKEYVSAGNKDGDNKSAINVKYNPYLNYINYTRGVSSEDKEDLISLVQFNMKFDFINAIKYLHKILGLKYKFEKKKDNNVEKIDPLSIFKKYASKRRRCNVLDFEPMDENILDEFIPYEHISWFREGIMPNTVKKFGLCYSYRQNRQIIPIRYWLDGSLLATNARTTIENYEELGIKKYFISKGYNKSNNLYGLFENAQSINKAGYITIVESEKSVLKRHSRFDETCVALQGHSMSSEQQRIILGMDIREVIIALDKDICEEEVWDMCEKFYRLRKVSFIYDKWDILGKKDSPCDAENKMYNFLFKHRITYDESYHKKYFKRLEKK